MRRPAEYEKKGWTQTADGEPTTTGGESSAGLAGVYGGRPDASRRALDQLVVVRVVATAQSDGHACQPADYSPERPEDYWEDFRPIRLCRRRPPCCP